MRVRPAALKSVRRTASRPLVPYVFPRVPSHTFRHVRGLPGPEDRARGPTRGPNHGDDIGSRPVVGHPRHAKAGAGRIHVRPPRDSSGSQLDSVGDLGWLRSGAEGAPALHSGAHRVADLPLGRLLLGTDAELQVAEFSLGKPTLRALWWEVVHWARAGQGWHWPRTPRARPAARRHRPGSPRPTRPRARHRAGPAHLAKA